jgi:hypothetical protein
MGIESLPTHLLLIIHSVLCVRPFSIHNQEYYQYDLILEYSHSEVVQEDTSWTNFLNTTKKFQELKFSFLYLSLNKTWSVEYLNNRFFRVFLQKAHLKNPRAQLALHLSDSVPSFTNLNSLHFIMLSNVQNVPISYVHEVKFIHLISCTFSEMNPVVHGQVVSLEEMEISFELITFTNLRKIYLFFCPIKHIARLNEYPHLKFVALGNCTFNQANERFSCQHLDGLLVSARLISHLTDCSHVNNVSLTNCNEATSGISAFYNSKYLLVEECVVLNQIHHFKFLNELVLLSSSGCIEFEISVFPELKKLCFFNCLDMKKFIINGTSLRKLTMEGKFPSLQMIDVQTSSLKQLYLTKLELRQDIIFFGKNKVRIMVVDTKGEEKICFA